MPFPRISNIERAPRLLFKYQIINDHLHDLISKNQLCFASRKLLNDPFEFNPSDINTENSIEEMNQFLDIVMRKTKSVIPNSYNDLANELIKDSPRWQKLVQRYQEDFLNRQGISCFSCDPFNKLMWSHYANSHKGVCLIFDLQKLLSSFGDDTEILPAYYSNEKEKINFVHEFLYNNPVSISGEDFEGSIYSKLPKLYIRKGEEWSYEREFRIIKTLAKGNELELHNFQYDSLNSLIFGINTPRDTEDEITSLLINHGFPYTNIQKCCTVEVAISVLNIKKKQGMPLYQFDFILDNLKCKKADDLYIYDLYANEKLERFTDL